MLPLLLDAVDPEKLVTVQFLRGGRVRLTFKDTVSCDELMSFGLIPAVMLKWVSFELILVFVVYMFVICRPKFLMKMLSPSSSLMARFCLSGVVLSLISRYLQWQSCA